MPLIPKDDCCPNRSTVAQLSSYEKCLVSFKLMTSQVVQRERPHMAAWASIKDQSVTIMIAGYYRMVVDNA